MNKKIFEFHGLDFKVIIVGLAWFLIVFTLIVTGIIFLSGTYFFRSSAFTACLAAGTFMGLFYLYSRSYKKLWRVIVAGETVEIYFNNKLRSRFALPELKKIHINGWFNDTPKGSYRWLRLTTELDKFVIVIGNTNLINTSSEREIKIFDEFFSVLEAYAIKNNYLKTELKKGYHESSAKNHYYLKNEIL